MRKKVLFLCGIIILLLSGCEEERVENSEASVTEGSAMETITGTEGILEPLETEEEESSASELLESNVIQDKILENNQEETILEPVVTEYLENIVNSETESRELSRENLLEYLEINYPIDGMHYEISDSTYNIETLKYDYDVYIVSNSKENDSYMEDFVTQQVQEMNAKVKNIFDVAKSIITEIPEINNEIHIYLVSWIASDNSASALLIQDYN